MTRRDPTTFASLLLTNRLVEVGADPLKSKEYWRLIQRLGDPGQLLGSSAASLTADHGLAPDLAERLLRLLDASTALALELEQFEQRGLHALSPFDEDYPTGLRDRLGDAAPPVLYVAGPPELLSAPGVAAVGSRNVTDEGAKVAVEVGQAAASHGLSLISGGAKGVDQLAMNAAYTAGGTAVGVLAEGLARRLKTPDTRKALAEGRVTLASPYKPTAGFSVATAMGRNKVIYALAHVTLVVATDLESGGTWSGAVEALDRGYGPVLVWRGDGEGPGNAELATRGATVSRHVGDLFEPVLETSPPAAQLEIDL